MKLGKFGLALAGLLLLGLGLFMIELHPYKPGKFVSTAGSCRMEVDVIEPMGGQAKGYVVLFHGLSANRRIMSYLAQDLANQNLRVFVPDFPGHGRTPGPFSPIRADACGEALVRELIERRSLLPEKTILAGHSMGGAIAIRVSSRVPVAGVIAISPAPMKTTKGIEPEMLLFQDYPPLARNSLVISGGWEPEMVQELAKALVAERNDGSGQFLAIPRATHVSLLFGKETLVAMRNWTRKVLGADSTNVSSAHLPLYGFLCGMIGLALLVVPFVKEIATKTSPHVSLVQQPGIVPSQALLQVLAVSLLTVVFVKFWIPLKFLRVFEGDYLASFCFIAGLALLAWNSPSQKGQSRLSARAILGAAFAAVTILLLFGLWMDYSFYEAWLTLPRWIRLPGVVVAVFPWLAAEEVLLGIPRAATRWRRVGLALAFRTLAWVSMLGAFFFLHSGEVLMVLLALYFFIFSFLQRMAMDVVRQETQSAAETALFGAILLAGFALAIFPIA